MRRPGSAAVPRLFKSAGARTERVPTEVVGPCAVGQRATHHRAAAPEFAYMSCVYAESEQPQPRPTDARIRPLVPSLFAPDGGGELATSFLAEVGTTCFRGI